MHALLVHSLTRRTASPRFQLADDAAATLQGLHTCVSPKSASVASPSAAPMRLSDRVPPRLHAIAAANAGLELPAIREAEAGSCGAAPVGQTSPTSGSVASLLN